MRGGMEMNFLELLGFLNLKDFRVIKGYWAETYHGQMKTLYALISETGKPFFCLEKNILEAALISLIPSRNFKINETFLLVNNEKRIAFDLSGVFNLSNFGRELEAHRVLSVGDIREMKTGDLKWES
jgi:hypothetical protein